MKTANLTIVFVDIKNFTPRTSSQSREANSNLLRRFADLVKPLAGAFGGKVVKSLGDAFLMTFHSPTDSLHCAMAIQDRLFLINQHLPDDEAFQVRLAINVGEVRLDAGDVFGEAVNIAARIEGLADGGDIWFSEAVYLVMNKSEVPFVEVGYRELKGISQPVRIYRIPQVNEVGDYRVTGSGRTLGKNKRREASASGTLPYGGFALERIRERGFKDRFRRSLSFRTLVLGVLALLVAAACWFGWQRFQAQQRELIRKEAAKLAAEKIEKQRFHWFWEKKR